MKPPPKSATELGLEATSLGLNPRSKLDSPRKELISYLWRSHHLNRAIGHATILLFGPTGIGKSSTINHMFNLNHRFTMSAAETSSPYSATREITEYNIINDIPKYDVKDVSIGIIDSPGVNDTVGIAQDACNLMAIKNFFEKHPVAAGCFPNLILILISAVDHTFDSPNGSFIRSLKCLENLGLVDAKHKNVVGVMTHTGSLAKRKDVWLSKFEIVKAKFHDLIEKYLQIDAPIVALENFPYEQDLNFVDENSVLPDGTLQPENLYLACAQLFSQNGDDFGLISFNSAFTGARKKPSKGFYIKPKDATRESLSKKENKLLEFCRRTLKGEGADDWLLERTEQYIKKKRLTASCADQIWLMTSKLKEVDPEMKKIKMLDQKNLLSFTGMENSPTIEDFLSYLGFEHQKSNDLDAGIRFLGQGFNIFTDTILQADIFRYNLRENKFGILLPEKAHIAKVDKTEIVAETFENEEEMLKSKLHRFNLGLNVKPSIFPNLAKAGFNTSVKRTSKNSTVEDIKEYSLLVEHRIFEITTGSFSHLTFTDEFRKEVEDLPQKFNINNEHNQLSFKNFFNKWGHFVISKAYCGGSVEFKVNSKSFGKQNKTEIMTNLSIELDTMFSNVGGSIGGGIGRGKETKESRTLEISQLKWQGGQASLHDKSTISDHKKMKEWRISLLKKPVVLATDLSLTPISELVSSISKSKKYVCHRASEHFLGGKIKSPEELTEERKILKENQTREEFNRKFSRRELKLLSPQKRKCFPGSAMVRRMKDGVVIDTKMKNLKIGQFVATQKGFSKILLFAHYAPDKSFRYLKINTSNKHFIRLSGNHLIFVSSINSTKLACQVLPGDKLIQPDGRSTSEVISIDELAEVGYFCPITEDGTIYVDGFLASCYASCKDYLGIDGHDLAHFGLLPMRWMDLKSVEINEIHPFINFLEKLPLPFRA